MTAVIDARGYGGFCSACVSTESGPFVQLGPTCRRACLRDRVPGGVGVRLLCNYLDRFIAISSARMPTYSLGGWSVTECISVAVCTFLCVCVCVCFLRDWEPPRRLHARVCDKASMVLARGPGARAGGMKLKFSIEGEKKEEEKKWDGWRRRW